MHDDAPTGRHPTPRHDATPPGDQTGTGPMGQHTAPDHDTADTERAHGPALRFVAAPLYEPAEWRAVRVDDMRNHWLTAADGTRHPVSPDAAGNWLTTRGPVLIYTADGGIVRPADDPIAVPDFEHERHVLTIAAARLRSGRPLGLEDEARADLARRRLAVLARLEVAA